MKYIVVDGYGLIKLVFMLSTFKRFLGVQDFVHQYNVLWIIYQPMAAWFCRIHETDGRISYEFEITGSPKTTAPNREDFIGSPFYL